jgi:hypothetical protein
VASSPLILSSNAISRVGRKVWDRHCRSRDLGVLVWIAHHTSVHDGIQWASFPPEPGMGTANRPQTARKPHCKANLNRSFRLVSVWRRPANTGETPENAGPSRNCIRSCSRRFVGLETANGPQRARKGPQNSLLRQHRVECPGLALCGEGDLLRPNDDDPCRYACFRGSCGHGERSRHPPESRQQAESKAVESDANPPVAFGSHGGTDKASPTDKDSPGVPRVGGRNEADHAMAACRESLGCGQGRCPGTHLNRFTNAMDAE